MEWFNDGQDGLAAYIAMKSVCPERARASVSPAAAETGAAFDRRVDEKAVRIFPECRGSVLTPSAVIDEDCSNPGQSA